MLYNTCQDIVVESPELDDCYEEEEEKKKRRSEDEYWVVEDEVREASTDPEDSDEGIVLVEMG
jgi:hypothetical protein